MSDITRIRDSGMPERELWESFFDAGKILDALKAPKGHARAADFGCGYGAFSIAAAERTSGVVYAFDIDERMVEFTAARARSLGFANVTALTRDVVSAGTGLADESVGYAMLFNVLHAERPTELLREAFRILEPDGVLAVIHWVYDAATPRGPDLSIRPRPEQCASWCHEVGFDGVSAPVMLEPYHYGLTARKPARAGS
jgi:SAM-dependent methyltransferase